MTTQLRSYLIEEGKMDEFIESWRTGVVPLRRARGFVVEGAWKIQEESRFIWIISHPGPEAFETMDRAYYDSPGRRALDPDPARLIVEADHTLMSPVEVPQST